MMIFCPSCQRQLRVPDGATGQRVKCPSCQEVFLADRAATGEEIQAPPAPRPTAGSIPADSYVEERRPRSSDRDDSITDMIVRGGDPEEALRRGRAAANWFFIAAAVTMGLSIVDIIKSVTIGELAHGEIFDIEPELGTAFVSATLICCGALLIAVNVLLVVGGLQLRSLGSKGWVITGIVAAFVQALIFGASALIEIIMIMFDPQEAMDKLTPLSVLFDGVSGFFNCFAGVKAILALNNPAVSAEFDGHRSRHRQHVRWED